MQAKGRTVLVVGSLHYDITVDAPRLPQRGETLAGRSWRPKFGGKGGNQAVAAAHAGAPVRMAGAVGGDGFGVFLLQALDRAGVGRAHVRVLAGEGSGMSVAVSEAAGDYAAVIVSGANLLIDPAGLAAPGLWEDVGALVLQNEVPDAVNLAAAQEAGKRGIPVFLNAAPARHIPAALEALVDTLIVNAIEAEQMCGVAVSDLASAGAAAERLGRSFPRAVVTAGGHGLAAGEKGGAVLHVPALAVTLVSTHGAGDSFAGALAGARVAGRSFREALGQANAAAARHVSGAREA